MDSVQRPFAIHLGPHEIALGLDIRFHGHLSGPELTLSTGRIERAIQAEHPDIRHVFIEAHPLVNE